MKLASTIILLLSLTATFLFSCSKSDLPLNIEEAKVTPQMTKMLKSELEHLPLIIRVKDTVNNSYIDFNVKNQTISTTKNWSFSNPVPNTIYASSQGLILYLSTPSNLFGMGSGSHTVVAGNTTLNVQTQCIAWDMSAFTAVSGTLPIDGVSMVIGLDADFSMLQNANTMCFSDFFKGLAYYFVYDSPASGSYTVIDWNNPNFTINSNDGYAFVFSFENCNDGKFYFSKSGNINVNGGDMTFQNGQYWELSGLLSSITTGSNLVEYPGSGTMGCN
jgi:hypothetical protein